MCSAAAIVLVRCLPLSASKARPLITRIANGANKAKALKIEKFSQTQCIQCGRADNSSLERSYRHTMRTFHERRKEARIQQQKQIVCAVCVCVFGNGGGNSPTRCEALAEIIWREPTSHTRRRQWQRLTTTARDRHFPSLRRNFFIACMHNGLADYCSNSHETLMNLLNVRV